MSQRFEVGARVRVRQGVADPDFPRQSLAGWAGVVREVNAESQPPLYLVAWSQQTLAAAPRKMRRRCETQGLDWETTWLNEADVEPDPTDEPFVPPPDPLDLDDPEDRARDVLGLAAGDELPPVTVALLARFHGRLVRSLKTPFPATLDLGESDLGSGIRPVMVLRILPAEQSMAVVGLMAEVMHEEGHFRVPLAILQPILEDSAAKDLEAYLVWIGTHVPAERGPGRSSTHPLVQLGVVVVLVGGVTGACIATVSGAELGAMLGAIVLGVVGFFAGSWYERFFRAVNRLPPGLVGGALLGMLAGSAVGAAVGAISLAYVGSIPGAIAGRLLSWLLEKVGVRPFGWLQMTLVGAGVGAVALSLTGKLPDESAAWPVALTGLGLGLLVGVVGAALLIAGVLAYLRVVFRYDDEQ